jgi:hypothetical protein
MWRLVLVLVLATLGFACGSSEPGSNSEIYFRNLEAGYGAYDAEVEQLTEEYDRLLPSATSDAAVDQNRIDLLREVLASHSTFGDALSALTPPSSLEAEHRILLDRVAELEEAWLDDLALMETGTASSDPVERSAERQAVFEAVDALARACLDLQAAAGAQSIDVTLPCSLAGPPLDS